VIAARNCNMSVRLDARGRDAKPSDGILALKVSGRSLW
jgi:hypothetical protein